ncbi:pantetheine-phosphate adenylyltransferase [Ilumatobacteraceae bacterium]|jgi:pantetheine-phosphate adenylyltransferase|nr:pantetheine-phosphate adenylyltransferase [Ilumatobacteraceae bacterium]
MNTAFLPGSFDPMHLGHLDVVDQALEIFGDVVIGIMHNPSKPSGLFSAVERVELARSTVAGRDGVRVAAFGGLAVQAAAEAGATVLVKGLRTMADFDIEQQMAQNNVALTGIRTVFVPCRPDRAHISSRFIREISAHGESVDHMVAPAVSAALAERHRDGGCS